MALSLSRKPYFHIRYTWWDIIDLDEVRKDLEAQFEVTELFVPSSFWEMALFPYHREHLLVKADSLSARLAHMRAVLYQRDWAPFTERDVELRRKIKEIYGRDLMTPLPLAFRAEPEFEVEAGKRQGGEHSLMPRKKGLFMVRLSS